MWFTFKRLTVQNFGWVLGWCLSNPLIGCSKQDVSVDKYLEEQLFEPEVPPHFPEWPTVHPDATAAQVELGRWLFYDRRLSIDGSRSCGICHDPARGFTDGLSLGLGIDNALLTLNSPSLFNVAWRTELTWYRQFDTIEDHMIGPLFESEPPEMGMTERLLEERLLDFERYPDLFETAFPNDVDPINTANAISAIASFTRGIISSNSRYDQWIQGEISFIVAEELGMELFRSERLKCSMCHGGVFFDQPVEGLSTSERHGYFNTGLYNLEQAGVYPETAQGLIETTGNQNDMGAFRVPTLRNLDATYPWMHDGSEIDLRNIIENYAAGGRVIQTGINAGDGRLNPYKSDLIQGFDISEEEMEALLAFLSTLNDDLLLMDERYASPFCIEQGGVVINEPCEPVFVVD